MRLIDADALKESILRERDNIPLMVPVASYELVMEKPFQHGNSMRGGIRKALKCMEQCPTIDAVPVVCCRECKYRDSEDNWCHFWGSSINRYDFCSRGEKKGGR